MQLHFFAQHGCRANATVEGFLYLLQKKNQYLLYDAAYMIKKIYFFKSQMIEIELLIRNLIFIW